MSRQREKTLLLVGGVLIVCTMAFSEWLEPPNPSSPPLHAGQPMNNPPVPQSGFALNFPEAKRTTTLKNSRNIFAPLKNPVAPKNVQVSTKTPDPITFPPIPSPIPSPTAATGPSPAEVATRQAKEAMQQYKFLGYLTKEGVRQGFLSKNETIYIVKEGETLEKGITIQSIDPTEVVLSRHVKQTGTTVEATLSLTKNKQDAS